MANKKHVRIKFPLSYNEIDGPSIATLLSQYEGRHHEVIVSDFESSLRRITNAENVIALQSGTAAMHLALIVAGVQQGDYVVAPTFAYIGSVAPVMYLGAIPAFVDCDSETWNLDPTLTDQAIGNLLLAGKRVAAIIVVHNYGVTTGLHEIMAIGQKHGIPIIEDAAEAFGSTVGGRWAGTIADVGVFSFNSNKTITAHGGGALVTRNAHMLDRARYLASHARSDKPYYEHNEMGYNYRMSPLLAANGLVQLAQMSSLLDHRRRVNEEYHRQGRGIGLTFQEAVDRSGFQPWLTACRLPSHLKPGPIQDYLNDKGIETRRLWSPLHKQLGFKGLQSYSTGVAVSLFEEGLVLPCGLDSGHLDMDVQSIMSLIQSYKETP